MEIVVPELGESIVEATIARWIKKEGDHVAMGEPVVELETDKVDLEVGAKQDGVLVKIAHQEGEDVRVGEVLGIIEATSASAEAATPGQTQPAIAPEPKSRIPEAEENPLEQPLTSQQGDGALGERVTPVARRLAQEFGVDLTQVPGSGPGERVTKEDVQRFLERNQQKPEVAQITPQDTAQPAATKPQTSPIRETPGVQTLAASSVSAPTAPDEGISGRQEERIRMSRRRRTIASRLVEAQQTAAMLTTFNDVDMSAVIEIRKRRKESFQERHGVKLGFMSFFVKATVGTLKEFPELNAEIQGDDIVLKHYYDIGIAIGAEEGLVVPVLRNADKMNFAEIEKAIQRYIDLSRQGTLSLEDLRGGTFTITNGGVYGSLLSTPILNPPQVGILGLHRIEDRPVAIDGKVEIKPMMYLALSYDHRIVDGREAVQFLVRLKELIQDPESLLLEG